MLNRVGDKPDDVLAKLLCARMEKNGALRPTGAGILLAFLDSRNWLPGAYIQAVAYRGTTVRKYTDNSYHKQGLKRVLCGRKKTAMATTYAALSLD